MGKRIAPATVEALIVLIALALAAGAGVIGWVIGRETAPSAVVTTTAAPSPVTGAEETVAAETGAAEPGTETPAEGRLAEGEELYLRAGCGACHGENAQGTEIGPSLPGHTVGQVRQQARSPLAEMPAYSAARLSDEDLDKIAEYIASLEPTEEHVEPVKLSNPVASHHWMAISAIKADDFEDALHHVGHIIEAVKGEHLEAMKEAEELLREGEAHDAEHMIEDMLAGRAEPELTLQQVHLQLALTSAELANRKEVEHHVGHFLERTKGKKASEGRAILAALREGDLHEVEDGIRALLGLGHE